MSNKDTRVGDMALVASRPVTSKRMHAVSAPESLEGLFFKPICFTKIFKLFFHEVPLVTVSLPWALWPFPVS